MRSTLLKIISVLFVVCSYKSMKCPGRLIRYLNAPEANQIKVTKEHTHIGDGRMLGKATAMITLKRKSTESIDRGRTVVAKLNENMDVATAASLPSTKSMMQTVRREREDSDLPKNPKSLHDLEIPESFKTINGKLFLLHDSGPGPNRILMYSTAENLELLKRADVMAIDGTFDIVPPLFEQLYTVQGKQQCDMTWFFVSKFSIYCMQVVLMAGTYRLYIR